jgi:U3 small nucleolar RNA-associated protein 7
MVQVFNDLQKPGQNPRMPPAPYMTHTFPGTAVNDVLFCPFDDILGVGHARGFTSLIIPGSGEPNFDSLEADPYEGKRRRREREVNALLDKIPFDLITLDIDLVGKLDKESVRGQEEGKIGFKEVAFAKKSRMERLVDSGKAVEEEDESSGEEDEDEEARKRRRESRVEKADAKKRARGRNSTLKKMLRKRRRNVVDPQTVSFSLTTRQDSTDAVGIGRDQGEDGTAAQGDSSCETERHGSSFRRFWYRWSPRSILIRQVDNMPITV